MTIAKVTQQDVEVLFTNDVTPAINVTQQDVEILYTNDVAPTVKVSQQDIEVLYTVKVPTILQTTSTETAQALTFSKVFSIKQATETNIAHPLSAKKVLAIAIAEELSTSLALISSSFKIFQATSTELAQALTFTTIQRLLFAQEVDISLPLTSQQVYTIHQAREAATSYPFSYVLPFTQFSEQTIVVFNPEKQQGLESTETVVTPHLYASGELFIGTLDITLPIAETIKNLTGGVLPSFSTDYYNTIHIEPNPLNAGNVFNEEEVFFTVWNAYLIPQTLSNIVPEDATGISILGDENPPHDYGALEQRTYKLVISPDGPVAINATYTFSFTDEDASLIVLGLRSIIWPFIPLRDSKEDKSWITDIVRSKTKETRFALRESPRVVTDYNYRFPNQKEFVAARALASSSVHLPTGLPKWVNVVKVPSIASGDTSLLIDTTELELVVGDSVILWNSYEDFEVLKLLLIESGKLTFSNGAASTRKNFALAPLLVGFFLGGVTFTESKNHKLRAKVTHQHIVGYESKNWDTPELFESLPILTVPSIVSAGLSTKLVREVGFFDGRLGGVEQFYKEEYNRVFKNISMIAKKEGLNSLRRQLDYLQGKFKSFWLPSFIGDMLPTNNLIQGGTEVRVIFNGWNNSPPQALRIIGSTTEYALVDTVVDNGDGTESLGLVTGLSVAITDVTSIQTMEKVRLNTDNISYDHSAGITRVKLPVVSVSNE